MAVTPPPPVHAPGAHTYIYQRTLRRWTITSQPASAHVHLVFQSDASHHPIAVAGMDNQRRPR